MTKFKTAVYRRYAFSECFLVQVDTTVRKILARYSVVTAICSVASVCGGVRRG